MVYAISARMGSKIHRTSPYVLHVQQACLAPMASAHHALMVPNQTQQDRLAFHVPVDLLELLASATVALPGKSQMLPPRFA